MAELEADRETALEQAGDDDQQPSHLILRFVVTDRDAAVRIFLRTAATLRLVIRSTRSGRACARQAPGRPCRRTTGSARRLDQVDRRCRMCRPPVAGPVIGRTSDARMWTRRGTARRPGPAWPPPTPRRGR